MDVTALVSEIVALKRRTAEDGALRSGDLVRWDVLRAGLVLAQMMPQGSIAPAGQPAIRIEVHGGVWDLRLESLAGGHAVVAVPEPLQEGERPVVLLVPPGEGPAIATRAVVGERLPLPGLRFRLAFPDLEAVEQARLLGQAIAPNPLEEELPR